MDGTCAAALVLVLMWGFGRLFLQMFPRVQAFVRALSVTDEGLQVNVLIHDLYLNRTRSEDHFYPWSFVHDVQLQGLNTVEGVDLGMYSVMIRLNGAEDIGGKLIIRYTKSQAANASSRARQCLEAIARCRPDALNRS